MEVTGKIIFAFPEVSGVSRAGNQWRKREYVLETPDSYPKKVHFSFFGDKADQFVLEPGQNVRLSFDIDSHEYNGRWFTSIQGWKAEVIDPTAQPQQVNNIATAAPAPQTAAAPLPPVPQSGDSDEDLPF